eukprot:gene46796-42138_t
MGYSLLWSPCGACRCGSAPRPCRDAAAVACCPLAGCNGVWVLAPLNEVQQEFIALSPPTAAPCDSWLTAGSPPLLGTLLAIPRARWGISLGPTDGFPQLSFLREVAQRDKEDNLGAAPRCPGMTDAAVGAGAASYAGIMMAAGGGRWCVPPVSHHTTLDAGRPPKDSRLQQLAAASPPGSYQNINRMISPPGRTQGLRDLAEVDRGGDVGMSLDVGEFDGAMAAQEQLLGGLQLNVEGYGGAVTPGMLNEHEPNQQRCPELTPLRSATHELHTHEPPEQ